MFVYILHEVMKFIQIFFLIKKIEILIYFIRISILIHVKKAFENASCYQKSIKEY